MKNNYLYGVQDVIHNDTDTVGGDFTRLLLIALALAIFLALNWRRNWPRVVSGHFDGSDSLINSCNGVLKDRDRQVVEYESLVNSQTDLVEFWWELRQGTSRLLEPTTRTPCNPP